MTLHNNPKLFSDAIRAASLHYGINEIFIEKDYWITYILNCLSLSEYAGNSVFKGGTSLSKAYGLIQRFSEDVDIAIIDEIAISGNQIKELIRNIEKAITKDLKEITITGVSSKGSRYRKTIFEYNVVGTKYDSNKVIVEINSFANPYPFERINIASIILEYLEATGNYDYIRKYNLARFPINVLDKRQTLIEKLVSLIRFSFEQDNIEALSSKIRHFYDLYYLSADPVCKEFINSSTFFNEFEKVLIHDREVFDLPKDWNTKSLQECPLIMDFPNIWKHLKNVYSKELAALAFGEIPNESLISRSFEELIKLFKPE